jgi:hypothetical protein
MIVQWSVRAPQWESSGSPALYPGRRVAAMAIDGYCFVVENDDF